MILKEFKDWINSLPEEFNEHTVVNGEVGMLNEEHMYRVDKPITTCIVDEETKEIVLMNDTEDLINTNIDGDSATEPGA
jgi:hypothetical protein